MDMVPEFCSCVDPTPVYGNITHRWYCFDCGADLTPAQVDGYAAKPVRTIA